MPPSEKMEEAVVLGLVLTTWLAKMGGLPPPLPPILMPGFSSGRGKFGHLSRFRK